MTPALSPADAVAMSRYLGGFLVDAAPDANADVALRRFGASVSGDPVTGIRIYRGGCADPARGRSWAVRVIPQPVRDALATLATQLETP